MKKKIKTSRKPARVAAKSKTAKKVAKHAKKPSRKIDPLNRKNYTSVSPVITVRDIRRAVDFYRTVFGFKVRSVMEGPQGPVHAELRLRDATLMLSPESPEQQSFSASTIGRTPVTLYALVENADTVFNRALSEGGSVVLPIADMFWGDRAGVIADLDGNRWMIATHKSEPTRKQMMEAMQKQMGQAASRDREAAAAAAAGSESEY